jgi:hypothetical protein
VLDGGGRKRVEPESALIHASLGIPVVEPYIEATELGLAGGNEPHRGEWIIVVFIIANQDLPAV